MNSTSSGPDTWTTAASVVDSTRPLRLAVGLVVFFAAFTWGAPISTVGDVLLIRGSLKYGDVCIAVLSFQLFTWAQFRRNFLSLFRCHRSFVIGLLALALVASLSGVRGVTLGHAVQLEHLAYVLRLIYYGYLVLFIGAITLTLGLDSFVLAGLTAGLLCVAVYTLGATYVSGGSYIGDYIKLSAQQGANPIGTHIALLFPIPVFYSLHANRRAVRWIARLTLITFIIVSVSTFAKASWLVICITILAFILWRLLFVDDRRFDLLFGLTVGGLLLTFIFGDDLREIVMLELHASGSNTAQRVAMYGEALTLFADHPILGIGVQNYPNFDPHTIYAQMLAETGLIGFLLFLFIFFYPAAHGLRQGAHRPTGGAQRQASVVPLLCLSAVYVMGFVTGTSFTLHIFWVISGLVMAYSAEEISTADRASA